MRQVIPNIYDTFTEEGGPGTVAAEVFEQFIWVITGVNGRTPFKEVSGVNVYIKIPVFYKFWSPKLPINLFQL